MYTRMHDVEQEAVGVEQDVEQLTEAAKGAKNTTLSAFTLLSKKQDKTKKEDERMT